MATSKTDKASKTAAKKGGRKTAENSPQTGEERFIATGKSVPCSSPQRARGAFLAERRASKWADAARTSHALYRRRYRRSSYSLTR